MKQVRGSIPVMVMARHLTGAGIVLQDSKNFKCSNQLTNRGKLCILEKIIGKTKA